MANIFKYIYSAVSLVFSLYPSALFKFKYLGYVYKIAIIVLTILYYLESTKAPVSKWEELSNIYRLLNICHYALSVWINVFISIKLVRPNEVEFIVESIKGLALQNGRKRSKNLICLFVIWILSGLLTYFAMPFSGYLVFLFNLRPQLLNATFVLVIHEIKMLLKRLNDDLRLAMDDATLQRLKRNHNVICDLIESLNQLFGGFMLINILLHISGTCRTATISLMTDIKEGWIYQLNSVFFTGMVFTTGIIGELLKAQSEVTVSTCYDILQTVHAPKQNRANTESMLGLAQQASQRQSQIIAVGFFPIDNSLILFILTNLCTFLIVLFQFV